MQLGEEKVGGVGEVGMNIDLARTFALGVS
jgi:hypothetical protein